MEKRKIDKSREEETSLKGRKEKRGRGRIRDEAADPEKRPADGLRVTRLSGDQHSRFVSCWDAVTSASACTDLMAASGQTPSAHLTLPFDLSSMTSGKQLNLSDRSNVRPEGRGGRVFQQDIPTEGEVNYEQTLHNGIWSRI
ncbi:uncharacterized protein V6R79_019559 [Siganus canaliculatus]